MDNIEKHQLMFMQLIAIFQTAAMQHLGKLKNPITDKIEQDLGQAQIAIDMLEMLQARTKNNISQEEEKALSIVLQDLRLNYVDEVMKSQATAPQSANTTTPQ